MESFIKEELHIGDIVVYLKNERTGSSTIRKCKFIGIINSFTKSKVKIGQLSESDKFVHPEECNNYGEVEVHPDDIICILHSRYKLDHTVILPQTIGNITFYNKDELINWIEKQQEINKKIYFR